MAGEAVGRAGENKYTVIILKSSTPDIHCKYCMCCVIAKATIHHLVFQNIGLLDESQLRVVKELRPLVRQTHPQASDVQRSWMQSKGARYMARGENTAKDFLPPHRARNPTNMMH